MAVVLLTLLLGCQKPTGVCAGELICNNGYTEAECNVISGSFSAGSETCDDLGYTSYMGGGSSRLPGNHPRVRQAGRGRENDGGR